jgi:phospholipid transport system substrate-binding protein
MIMFAFSQPLPTEDESWMRRLGRCGRKSLLNLMTLAGLLLGPALIGTAALHAQGLPASQSPDTLIKMVTQGILDTVRNDRSLQSGDLTRLNALVDQRVMPVVNFSRMTALTVGIHWRRASPEQQDKLMAAFRELLLLTYSDALKQVQDTTVQVRPARYAPEDTDVIVRTFVVRTGKEPIQLDYRLEKTPAGWKIYDFNVLGLWLVDHYRSQFGQLASARGIDGLIAALNTKNQSLRKLAAKSGS